MSRSMLSAIVSIAVCWLHGLVAGAELTLTRDGQPAAAIILDERPVRAAQFAAFELQWHVKAISGATLPILRGNASAPEVHVKLYVGDGPRAQAIGLTQGAFQLQEYAIRSGANEIVLVGKDAGDLAEVKYDLDALGDGQKNFNWPGFWEERGTLHAVHDFLRDGCGVRWFNPTDTGTVIPRHPTLTVNPRDLRRAPTFRYRQAFDGNAESYDRYVSIWGRREEGFKPWESAAYSDSRGRQGDNWLVRRLQSTLFLLRQKNGGEKCVANHSLYHYYELFWRPSKNEAAAKYFVGKRPELFAQGYEGDQPPQMCYTSRALVEQVTQEARDYFDKGGYPYKVVLSNAPLGYKWGDKFFCIEPMDNASFCKCPECQKLIVQGKDYGVGEHFSTGIHSDYMFNFVNEVSREVKKSHPDKNIVTLAYGTHAWVPKAVRLDPYVAVQFCFACDGAPWLRSEYVHELGLVKAWAEEAKTSKRPLYAWCYYGHMYRAFADNGNFHCFPGFFAHAIADEMKLYKRLGYRGTFHCGLPPEVDTYVTFRLMDNADLNVDKVLDEYFTGMYGAAAAPMKKLYLGIEKVYCDPKLRPTDKRVAATGVEAAWGYLGTAERMVEFGKLMDEARARAATERDKLNVELFDLGIWKYMRTGRAKYQERVSAPIPSVTAPSVPDAGGDATQVEWGKAAPLGDKWFDRGGSTPASRQFTGRIAHDGKWLYLEMVDPCDTAKLVVSPGVSCFDDWEFFFSGQRSLPNRQFLVGPTGMVVALLNGEVNWRMYVPLEEHGIEVVSDTSAPDKWVSRIAIPLKEVVPGGAKAGDTVFLNIIRVSSPGVSGQYPFSITTWVSHTTVHEVDRSASIMLEK